MAFPNNSFPLQVPGDPVIGTQMQSILNFGMARTNFRLAPAGIIPIQATSFGELERRAALESELARIEATRALDTARAMELEREADHRLRLMNMMNRSSPRSEFTSHELLVPPGTEDYYDTYRDRDRGRDRDRDQRDSRRDGDRDRGR